ncbi:hypothetical protein ACJ41O_013012 [Fusarium nematophilum]
MAAHSDQTPSAIYLNAPATYDGQFDSHAVGVNRSQRLVWTSGIIGRRPDGTLPDTFLDQVNLAIDNLLSTLHAAGATGRDLVQLNMYAVDWKEEYILDMQPAFVKLLGTEGGATRPTSLLVPVKSLAYPELKFEIQVTAAVPGLGQPWQSPTSLVRHEVPRRKVDVVVVGAGFSGLQAAHDIQEAGLSSLVLEARHRIGGRSHTHKLTGRQGHVELGATWINKNTQPKVYALAVRLGLEMSEQYLEGASLTELPDGTVAENDDMSQAIKDLVRELESGMAVVDIQNPTDFPRELDISVAEWMDLKGLNPLARAALELVLSASYGQPSTKIGIHYALDHMKGVNGWVGVTTDGPMGGQYMKIRQGTSAIASGLASELAPGSILVESPVKEITQYANHALVKTSNGEVIEAKKVIMANPINTYDYIRFTPPLPRGKAAIASQALPSIYAKVLLSYSSPWWREIGLAGKFTSLTGPICFSWDTCDLAAKQYSLAAFVSGPVAEEWHKLPALKREQSIISHLARLVGPEHEHLAQDVLEVNLMEWTKEEFVGGAPGCSMPPGVWSKHAKDWRDSFQHVHFAGNETAFEWRGYLEGALLAGSRAAKDVKATLVKSAN